MRQKLPAIFTPSRLFIYYNERAREHTVSTDSGASLRDGIKCVAAKGACPENLWPYVDDGRTFTRRPSKPCFSSALEHRAISYARIPRSLAHFKTCLAAGFPFVFGFSIYESFMSDAVAASGEASMPQPGESLLGGHAVAAVGYDDTEQLLVARNSWGTSWGLDGYFLLPYQYLLNEHLSDDFWTIRSVE